VPGADSGIDEEHGLVAGNRWFADSYAEKAGGELFTLIYCHPESASGDGLHLFERRWKTGAGPGRGACQQDASYFVKGKSKSLLFRRDNDINIGVGAAKRARQSAFQALSVLQIDDQLFGHNASP
jgi:hypothetical protein